MKLLPLAARWRLACSAAITLFAILGSAGERQLPAGVRIPVVLTKSVGAKLLVGAPVQGETSAQVTLPGSLGAIPRGARITGRVSLALPYDKKESRFSIVLERIETTSDPLVMRAFIVGRLRARNSRLGKGPGRIYGVEVVRPGQGMQGHIPAIQQIPIDSSCKLVKSESPDIGSEVVSKEGDVEMDIGSTFDVMTVED